MGFAAAANRICPSPNPAPVRKLGYGQFLGARWFLACASGGAELMEDIHALAAGVGDMLRSDPRLADGLGELF